MQSSPASTVADRPKLGVDVCDSCGRPPTVVGPLSTSGDAAGLCRYCEHNLERWDLLADEVVPILRDWYRACLDRDFPAREIEDVVDAALERLVTETRSEKVTA